MRRLFSIGTHIAKKIPQGVARVLRRAPPVEVLADEWIERYGKHDAKRKILYLGAKYDYGIRSRGLSYEEHNFLYSIKDLNVNIVRLDIYTLHLLYGKRVTNEVIKEVALREGVDTIFYFHYLDILDHDMIQDFTDNYSDVETIIWLCDDDVRYYETKGLANCFNKVVTTISNRHADRKKRGMKSHLSQFYANKSLYRNLNLKKEYDAVFIGQKFGNRGRYVKHLRKNGIDVRTFGMFWGKNTRLSYMDMIETINKAKIMLNFSSSSADPKKKFVKGRVFEILACGTFLLSEECSDMSNYLAVGKDVATFKNKEELLTKVRHYLKHAKERERIAKNGERKVKQKYSFQNEFKKILGV